MMTEVHTATLNLELYVPNRDMPLHWPLRIDVDETITSVNQIMAFAYSFIEESLADRRELNLVLVDERFSRHVIPKDNILAFSIQAPDADFITWGEDTDE